MIWFNLDRLERELDLSFEVNQEITGLFFYRWLAGTRSTKHLLHCIATCFGMQCSKSNYDKVNETGREPTSLMQHLDGS